MSLIPRRPTGPAPSPVPHVPTIVPARAGQLGMPKINAHGLVNLGGIPYLAIVKERGLLTISWAPDGLVTESSDFPCPVVVLLPPDQFIEAIVADVKKQAGDQPNVRVNPA